MLAIYYLTHGTVSVWSRSRSGPTNSGWNGLSTIRLSHRSSCLRKEKSEIFQSFTEVENPEDNQYIYHPKVNRAAFVTPRSSETASHICKMRDKLGADTTTALLIGCVGEHAARQLNAPVTLSDDLVPLDDIKNNPKSAKIPSTAAAQCMMMYRTLSNIDRSWMDSWMDYMDRLLLTYRRYVCEWCVLRQV